MGAILLVQLLITISLGISAFLLAIMVLFSCWVLPFMAYRKLKANGFSGPKPSFPFGNLNDIKMLLSSSSSTPLSKCISNDIHSTAFPYFSLWQKLYGEALNISSLLLFLMKEISHACIVHVHVHHVYTIYIPPKIYIEN